MISHELDIVIQGGTMITMDPDRRILRDGAIGIKDGKIVAIEACGDDIGSASQVINAHGSIVLPGIVDSHGHAGHSLTRGFGDGEHSGGWYAFANRLYFEFSDVWFWEAESRLAALERLRFGITTSVSMTGSFPRIDDAKYAIAASVGYRELGLRHIAAAGPPTELRETRRYVEHMPDGSQRVHEVDLDRALRVTEDLVQAYRDLDHPRVQFYVGPSQISPTDDPGDPFTRRQVNGVQDIVEKYNAGLHTHATAGQVGAAYAIRPDMLRPGVSMAHCSGVTSEEITIMAKTGVSAISGPLTHAYITMRFPLMEALDAGVNAVFATDGSAPDRSFDLIDQARIGVQLQRVHFNDASLIPAGKALAMITIDAAKALGMEDEVGSLEVGKRADVTLIDARQPHLAPEILAPLRVIGHASGQDVHTVIVDGQILMLNREIPGVDQDAIMDDAKAALDAAWSRAGFGDMEQLHPDTWFGLRYREI
ncbi:MAG: amidohydrolase family protein [Thermomicrobiales bacterium]|nr:amidohydrolase family protein [Thermomicrobiales bacterium]